MAWGKEVHFTYFSRKLLKFRWKLLFSLIIIQKKLYRSMQNKWKPRRKFMISRICWFPWENRPTQLQPCWLTVSRFSCAMSSAAPKVHCNVSVFIFDNYETMFWLSYDNVFCSRWNEELTNRRSSIHPDDDSVDFCNQLWQWDRVACCLYRSSIVEENALEWLY